MKIKRFEQINESENITDYIQDFDGSCDDGIIGWIQYVAKGTNLKEYTNIYDKKFQEDKKLVAYNKFVDAENKINNAQKEIYKLEKLKIFFEIKAKSEIMYKFQEDLLEKDTSSFYRLFVDEEYWGENENGEDDYGETHPNIIKKYKEKLDTILAAKKYNV